MKQLHGLAKPQNRWSKYNINYCNKCGKKLCLGNISGRCLKHREISDITKKNMSDAHIGINDWMVGKKHSEATKIKISLNHIGENNPNWKGGISPLNRLLRVSAKWQIWRNLVFLRDNFTCQYPNCEYCHNKVGAFLHPHHKKPLSLYPELAFDVNNGITYCKEFHLKSKLLHQEVRGRNARV